MPDQMTIDAVVDLERKYGDGHHSFEMREGIFDLIMAAKAEEREACAVLAEEYEDDHDKDSSIHIAAEIRKRTENAE